MDDTEQTKRERGRSVGDVLQHPAINPLTVLTGIGFLAWGGFRHSVERGCYLLGSLLIALPLAISVLQFFGAIFASRINKPEAE